MAMAAAPAMPIPVSPPGPGWLGNFMPGLGSSGAATAAGAAAKAGAQAIPSAVQGFGLGVGVRASGIVGRIFGWFAEMLTSWGPYDTFVKMAAVVYIIDVFTGFNPSITIPLHLFFAWAGFFVIGILDRKGLNINVWSYIWVSIIFLYMFFVINNGIGFLTRVSVNILPLALALAFYFGVVPLPRFSSRVPMPLFGIPIVAAIDVFGLNIFRDRIIDLAGNFNILTGGVAFVLGRLVNPLLVIYGATFMYDESKVAKKVFTILFIIYVTAALWGAFGHVAKLRGAGVTSAEISQGTSLLQSATKGMVNLVTLKFLTPSIALAQDKAYETFGFGTPKEQPKLGLALSQDSTMPKRYDLSYKNTPEPSFVMRITSPFPAGTEKPYIEVTRITCKDNLKKTQGLAFNSATTSKGVTPSGSSPLKVFYNGPNGGTQVKCSYSGWQAGDYSIGAVVEYKVDATAFLTTAFIRSDQDEALRLQGLDPAVVDKIPPANARYDNVPVSLTWGPPDLTKSPASIDVGKGAAIDPITLEPVTTQNMLITVYVSKNAGWENSDINSISNLMLTVPTGVALVGDSCDFDIKKAKTKDGGVTEYPVLDTRINKDGKPRFIGDSIRLECGMKVDRTALSGSDWAPARFDLSGSFIFTAKLDSIRFTVEDARSLTPASSQSAPLTPQQLQDKCAATGGTWNAATATTAGTCDCGAGKKWDVSNGCVATVVSCGLCYTQNAAGTACEYVKNGINGGCASGYACDGAGSCVPLSPPLASPSAADFVN